MELYQLEELAALAEYGSISKAAESVGVSQQSLQHLQNMDQYRRRRRVSVSLSRRCHAQ